MQPAQQALIIGCGHKKPGRFLRSELSLPDDQTTWTTLDINPDCYPDVIFDLNYIEMGSRLPFEDDFFHEIHCYEVMEHYGRQGDYKGFFAGMKEFWRILKPGGFLFGTSPGMHSVWAWGDPGHTRVISAEMFSYLCREHYAELGKNASSDYRRLVDPCWWIVDYDQKPDDHIHFGLQKEPIKWLL